MVATKYKEGFHKKLARDVPICIVETAKTWQIVYLYISLFLFYLLPCFSLFLLYGNIVLIIKRRSKKAGGSGRYSTGNGSQMRSRLDHNSIHRHSLKNGCLDVPNHHFEDKLIIKQAARLTQQSRSQQLYLEAIEDDDAHAETNLAGPESRKSSSKSFGKTWSSKRNDKEVKFLHIHATSYSLSINNLNYLRAQFCYRR